MSKPIFSCSRFEKILSLLHGYNVPYLCENFIAFVCFLLLFFYFEGFRFIIWFLTTILSLTLLSLIMLVSVIITGNL